MKEKLDPRRPRRITIFSSCSRGMQEEEGGGWLRLRRRGGYLCGGL